MRRRRFAALIVLVVVHLAVPGRAYASEWPSVSVCTEAEITGVVLQHTHGPHRMNVGGYVRPCPGAGEPQARWSFARYETGAANVVARPVPYEPVPNEPTDVRGRRFGYHRDVGPGIWAVCVVNEVRPTAAAPLLHEANRVACLGPNPAGPEPGPGGSGPGPIPRTLLVPLPVDDPRFNGALLTDQDPNGPRPICAGCV